MPPLHRISRRLFLVELGRGALAVGVLGTAAVACSGDDDDDEAADTTTTSAERAVPQWRRVSLDFVSAYVLIRGRDAAVVDTGFQGSSPKIEEALTAGGAAWDAVRHVIVTHHHDDHAGNLSDVLLRAADATAYAGEPDIETIKSTRPLEPVGDGDEVFGLQIIATPGHTAGHISVLDPETSYLVAGDALTGQQDGGVGGSNPQFTSDAEEAKESVRKLAELDFETAVFGHGEPIESGAAKAVQALAADL